MNKTMEKLNLEDDFLFAKVMLDEDLCKRVLEIILGISIKKIVMPTKQKVIDLLLKSKGIRLDIYVNDEEGTVYNVEMQRGRRRELPKRSRYYQGNIDLDLIEKGEPYTELKPSFVIFICTFDPFEEGRHLYVFENICKQNTNLCLGDGTKKVFLNTKGTLDDVTPDLKEFLKYVEDSTDAFVENAKSDLVKALHNKVKEVKSSEELEVEYMTLLQRDLENREEGKLEGKREGKREVAIQLLDVLDIQTISEKTGLSIEEIKALKEQ